MTASSMVFFGKYPRIYPCNSHVVNIMILDKYNYVCMEVSRNGTPKSSTLVGISIISQLLGYPHGLETPTARAMYVTFAPLISQSLLSGVFANGYASQAHKFVTVKPLEPSKKASFFDGFSSPNHL